ncbi:MAG: RagB/SusD family nutrient uptake outer membrane protein [Bacteroidales bacterium]|nr:RagB/SusD family nutrient uptake outer membrane protein [Bacteroidales bacterium]
MKPRIFLAIIFTIAFILGSCEDFLEERNKTGKTEDIVYSTESAIDGLVAGCYAYNRFWYGREGGIGLSEAGSDLWYSAADCKMECMNDYTNLTADPGSDYSDNNACLDEYWELLYTAVNLCNTAEKYVEASDVLSDAKKTRLLSEVRFLRAFYYWHMVETWGGVQLNTEPVATPSTTPVRNSVDEIYDQMFTDVQFAIDNLDPAAEPSSRVTHWAARAFKARLALYYASAYYGHTEYYTTAAEEAKQVIDYSGKSLYDNYEDVWQMSNSSASTNDEFIWAIDYYEEYGTAQSYNFLPVRLKTDANGNSIVWAPQVQRQPRSASLGSGNALHLYYTPNWNVLYDDVGGPSLQDVLRRVAGPVNFYTMESDSIQVTVDVEQFYVTYAMGYRRYGPTPYCLRLFDETMDERYSGTFRTAWLKHPDVVPKYIVSAPEKCLYPDMADTAVYISKDDLTPEKRAWASTRYKAIDLNDIFFADESMIYGLGRPGAAAQSGSSINGEAFYPMMRKFEDTDGRAGVPTTNFQDYWTYKDFPVFRISEMYLIAAEALISSNQAEAVSLINTLREKRAFEGKEADMRVSSVDLDFILEERARELAGENQRWFDLKRTKKLEEQIVYNAKSKDAFDPTKHYLRPIPSSQMNAITNVTDGPAEGGFWQNPEY